MKWSNDQGVEMIIDTLHEEGKAQKWQFDFIRQIKWSKTEDREQVQTTHYTLETTCDYQYI